jgi:hypothetical protein
MRAILPESLNPVITIPESLREGATNGPWTIRHNVAKLQRKYGGDFSLSREFDAYGAARAAQDPSWRNRIEMVDLLATWMMQSQIERRAGAIEAVMEKRADIEAELAKVPEELALEEEHISEQTWSQLEILFRTFRLWGVSLATMTKVLSLKRPALIPMLDSHVMGFLFQKERPLQDNRKIQDDARVGVVGMRQFRELMRHGKNLEALTSIGNEINSWLAGQLVSSHTAPVLSAVRLLDCLLWYDWNGHTYFGTLEDGLAVSALIARLTDGDHSLQWRAAKALSETEPAPHAAIPTLVEVCNDERQDSLVRWWAGCAVKKINPAAATEAGLS